MTLKSKKKRIKEPESKGSVTGCHPASPSSWLITGWSIPHPTIPPTLLTFTPWNWVMKVLHKINTFLRLFDLLWLPSCFHPHSLLADSSLFSCCRSVTLGLSWAMSHHSDSRDRKLSALLETHTDLTAPPHLLIWIFTLHFAHQGGFKGRSPSWSKDRKANLWQILREEMLKSMPPGLGSLLLDKTKTSFSTVVHYLITRDAKVVSKRYF